jgi:hypothetical protein
MAEANTDATGLFTVAVDDYGHGMHSAEQSNTQLKQRNTATARGEAMRAARARERVL